jgi:uncharacterized protein
MKTLVVLLVTVLALPFMLVGEPISKKAFGVRLAEIALARTKLDITYDPAYVLLDYPGGDVPTDRGVCSDVVVRSYRELDIDLQRLVHEDMKGHFSKYPKKWGLKRPDKNIDHRRVPNLQTFFTRFGKSLPKSTNPKDYAIGDIVAWDLNNKGLTHIGIVVKPPNKPGERWIVHNIGSGPQLQDGLFNWKIIGHYRFALKR